MGGSGISLITVRNLTIAAVLVFWYPFSAGAQICGPAGIDYIVRDGKGKVVDAFELPDTVFSDEKGHFWHRIVGSTSLSADADDNDSKPVNTVLYQGGNDCHLDLDELTITLGGKKMHLVFGLSLNSYDQRALAHRVVDSLPFAEGTFSLKDNSETRIPASNWKKVSDKP